MEDEFGSVTYGDKIYNSTYFNEIIKVNEAEILGKYEKFFYKGTPAITKNKYGKGEAYHIGTLLEEEGFEKLFIDLFVKIGIKGNIDNKKILYSEYAGREYIFNFSNDAEKVKVREKEYLLEPISYLIIEE